MDHEIINKSMVRIKFNINLMSNICLFLSQSDKDLCLEKGIDYYFPHFLPSINERIQTLGHSSPVPKYLSHHWKCEWEQRWDRFRFKTEIVCVPSSSYQNSAFLGPFSKERECLSNRAIRVRAMIELIYHKFHIRNLLLWSRKGDLNSYISLLPFDILKIIIINSDLFGKSIYDISFFP